MFPDIEREPIVRVREAIKSGLFKKDNPIKVKQKILKELNKHLSKSYGLKELPIEFREGFPFLGQFGGNKIILNKTSLVTFLHEFAHYKFIKKNEGNSEEKARGWSISLFYLATPILCKSAIEKGLILHQNSLNIKPIEEVQGEQEE